MFGFCDGRTVAERHTCELSFRTSFCALHLTKTYVDVGDPEVDRVADQLLENRFHISGEMVDAM
jgi:hypothetical protein